jgi:hypothetical protein
VSKVGALPTGNEQADATVKTLLRKEVRTMLHEVERLVRQQKMLDERLNHVMKLVVSVLNIRETRASLTHSESMKQMCAPFTFLLVCLANEPA